MAGASALASCIPYLCGQHSIIPPKTVMYSISFSSVNMETAGNMMVDIYYMSEHDVQSLAEKRLVTVFPNGGELQQA